MKNKLLVLVAIATTLPASAFWFKPIIEINHDASDPSAKLAMLAGKKYRIKFYNIQCPDCKTIVTAGSDLEDSLNIRTDIKRVNSKTLSTHHVIEVSKHAPTEIGSVKLSAIHGIYTRELETHITSKEDCETREKQD